MYNALLRKGYDDTPADAVESMVAVHNFLNEGAWAEIVGWERRFAGGLARGWRACREGEKRFEDALVVEKKREGSGCGHTVDVEPSLIRFQGRPGDLTPKARMLQILGQFYPAKFRYGRSVLGNHFC